MEQGRAEQIRSQSSIKTSDGTANESFHEEKNTEMLLVDANENDYDACDDEDHLMTRVWWLSKPPVVPVRNFVVPARRIQIVKERLLPTIEKLDDSHDESQAVFKRHSSKDYRRRSDDDITYIPVTPFDAKTKKSCQKDTHTTIPSCAQNLGDLI